MRHTESESLTDVLYKYLREQGLEMPLNEFRLIQAWNHIMGKTVSKYTSDLRIYNQTLFVTISSASLRNEIMMRRAGIIKALNDYVGAQVICGISVR